MRTKKATDKEIQDQTYQLPQNWKAKLTWLAITLFLLSLWLNFPIKQSLETLVVNQLNSSRACPISYQKLDFSLLFPSVHLSQPVISGRCFQNPRVNLKFDKLKTGFSFFGLLPPALKFHAIAQGMGSEIKLYPRIGFGQTDIRITNTRLSGKLISNFTQYPKLLKGDVHIDGLIELAAGIIQKADLKVSSQNLSIPSQKIQAGFIPLNIPNLEFKKLKLLATQTKKNLRIKALELGQAGGPLHLQFKGTIIINKANFNFSALNLEGRLNLSQEILDQVAALKLVLPREAPKDGYYNLKLSGTINRPVPKFL